MRSAAIFTLVPLLAAGGMALPTSNEIDTRQDNILVIFKTYADAPKCRPGQGSDDYSNIVLGYRSQAISGECLKFSQAGGWDGLKAVAHYATDDLNATGAYMIGDRVGCDSPADILRSSVLAYAYPNGDCVDNGHKAALFDSVCQSTLSKYLSWNFVKW
ncbi:uncharacterized protein B0I36DRAFT_325121 [Microdochium trichocladiopsis]|uniref:Ecp2 effector protein domain-containing protein n=1 Tax=Microdochium trichocladiopsis TaxID=1682393 RepID=A0A9P9BPI6_9PEZI|nr:uncharacterized protein B0I36DRAFT_325121 [Microdochium trichocladiopsis]KAH7029140.1 hypothetical protein B0I36DRAFT_325121 [Microdochium trichocladiopsis]